MFVLVFGLVAAVQLALLVAVHTANQRIASESIERHLAAGEGLFREVFRHREDQLVLAAQVLSADFAFRGAVGTGDLETAVSALENHAGRIGADVAILVDTEGSILADTLSRKNADRPFGEVVQVTWDESGPSGIGRVAGGVHQLLSVPVKAPLTIAHLVMGFEIDDSLAEQLHQQTGLEVAFLAIDDEAARPVGATVTDLDWARLIPREAGAKRTADERYEAVVTPLGNARDASMFAILMVPRQTILAPFDWLRSLLLSLAVAGLVLSAFGSVALSRGIARPLVAMAGIAGKYAEGDFDEVPETDRADELGVLAAAFANMRDALFERERRITRLAYYDPLTELANRTLFEDRLQQSLALTRRREQPLTVMVLDLDRFKEINGTLGHRRGDRILRQVGERLRRVMRASDTLARLGGDEFALLLHDADEAGATVLAAKIHEVLLDPVSIDGDRIDVSISVGGAVFPQHGEDVQSLLAHADVAMYAAKEHRSGFTMFDPTLDADRRGQLSLLGELRRAVEQGEIELWYQPKIDASGVVTAVEALVRWRHPERGMVSPAGFIDFAERTGFIKEITRHVLDVAVAQSASWRRSGIDLRISVNVSAKDLYDRALPEYVRDCLNRHGARAADLVLEITETAVMVSPENALEVLGRLRADGIATSIDDFGVGHSSLGYLRRLPAQELKIDRVFVSEMTTDPEAAAIVRAAVDLGHTMGMRVVGEGVEDAETWEAMRALGCDFGQGYWFAKPMPAAELEAWLLRSEWSSPRTAASPPVPSW